ncbi:epoxyqueuosine reductase QueH [bacterium]|nr:epoxyqueuosine reductase QueH [bacterium]
MSYRLVLHICCAPDATIGIERLSELGKVLGLFNNPNIEPIDEYFRRETEARRLAVMMGFDYRELEPDREAWLEAVAGYEDEPERGERCRRCIAHNLENVALEALRLGIPAFATTLTASPHKDIDFIHDKGKEIAVKYGLEYIDMTLRKKDGVRRSLELTHQHGLYRQDYCGCRWSQKNKG